MRKFLAILILALVVCGCGGSDKKSTPQKPTVVYSTYSNEQLQEMRTAYRQVLTNTLKPICVNADIKNEHWVNVYVNSLWYELNQGQKTEFITRCKNTYAGMLGARGLTFDFNKVNIFINLNSNEKILGKWTTFGVSISE